MKNNLLTKVAVAFGAASLVAGGCVAPAQADPASVADFGVLAGFGSDTTQDVMNGVAAAVNTTYGSTLLASYDALGGKDVYSELGGPAVPRANGSGAGRDLLRIALGQINTGTVAVAPSALGVARSSTPTTSQVAGHVDFARSSSGPSGAVSNGVVTYVPFATDSMTYVTSPDSKIPNGLPLGTDANNSEESIMNIYQGNLKWVIIDSTSGAYIRLAATNTAGAGEEGHRINVYVPQAGSGTRSYWLGKVVVTETNITNGDSPATATIVGGTVGVQEHDGTAVAADPYAIAPFSISQWVAQANGVSVDRRHGAVLNSVGGTSVTPTLGSGNAFSSNPDWTSTLKRTVYNIIPTALANDAGSNPTKTAFVGQQSLVCQAKTAITTYGFGLLTYVTVDGADKTAADAGTLTGSGATHCGSIVAGNRVYAPSSSTVSLGAPVKDGNSATVTATVTSNGNKGGTVTLYTDYQGANETEVGTGTVLPGQTTVDITLTNNTASAVNLDVKAEFLPTLSGVDYSSTASATTVSLDAKPADVTETATTFGTVTKSANGQAVTVRVNVADKGTATGTVNLYDGSVSGPKVGSATIASGASYVDITLEDVTNRAARSYNLVAEFVSDDNTVADSVSESNLAVAIKGAPQVATAFTYTSGKASAKKSVVQNLTVTVKNGNALDAAGANGEIVAVVYNGSAFVAEKIATVVDGTATISLGKFSKAATYTVRIYFGTSEYTTTSVKKTFKLTK